MQEIVKSLIPSHHSVVNIEKINGYHGLIKVSNIVFPFILNGYKVFYYFKIKNIELISSKESYDIDSLIKDFSFKNETNNLEPILYEY